RRSRGGDDLRNSCSAGRRRRSRHRGRRHRVEPRTCIVPVSRPADIHGVEMAKSRAEIEAKLRELEERVLISDARMVERQHGEGKLTARERIDRLVDPGSFVEEFMMAETQVTDFGMAERRLPTDGVVTGYGTVDGRPVYVFAQDRTVLQGAVGQAHGEKIAYVIETAGKLGVPVVGLFDS